MFGINHVTSVIHLSVCVLYMHAQGDSRAYAPRFPKTKDEGWWLVLGEVDNGELLALKRIGCIKRKTRTTLAFATPEKPCRKILTLYLMSDCYLGLDQQFDFSLNFVISENDKQ